MDPQRLSVEEDPLLRLDASGRLDAKEGGQQDLVKASHRRPAK